MVDADDPSPLRRRRGARCGRRPVTTATTSWRSGSFIRTQRSKPTAAIRFCARRRATQRRSFDGTEETEVVLVPSMRFLGSFARNQSRARRGCLPPPAVDGAARASRRRPRSSRTPSHILREVPPSAQARSSPRRTGVQPPAARNTGPGPRRPRGVVACCLRCSGWAISSRSFPDAPDGRGSCREPADRPSSAEVAAQEHGTTFWLPAYSPMRSSRRPS